MTATLSPCLETPSKSVLLGMYRSMRLIRQVEDQLADDFKAGKLIAGVHLYTGQEAVAVGVCAHLGDRDWIASNHRGHGHFLAKGGDVKALFAEIHAKVTGACKGMGGTMHVADFSKGIMGANGIVGGGVSLICGAALSCSLKGERNVAVVFFGDGAATQGVLAEALNLAALWRLPMIFICENNLFSEFSLSSTVVAGDITARAAPYGVPAIRIDGNDVQQVWQSAKAAVDRARDGDGPSLIEAMTYRLNGHVEAETGFLQGAEYRAAEEVASWRERDPLLRFTRMAQARGLLSRAELDEVDASVHTAVLEAMAYAESSAEPPAEQAFRYMFADAISEG